MKHKEAVVGRTDLFLLGCLSVTQSACLTAGPDETSVVL